MSSLIARCECGWEGSFSDLVPAPESIYELELCPACFGLLDADGAAISDALTSQAVEYAVSVRVS